MYTLEKNPNCGYSVYKDGLFLGHLYNNEITSASGWLNYIHDLKELCKFMVYKYNTSILYTQIQNNNNQSFYKVRINEGYGNWKKIKTINIK